MVLAWASILFFLSVFLGPLCYNLPLFVGLRFAQGLLTSVWVPISLSILDKTFPESLLGTATGVWFLGEGPRLFTNTGIPAFLTMFSARVAPLPCRHLCRKVAERLGLQGDGL